MEKVNPVQRHRKVRLNFSAFSFMCLIFRKLDLLWCFGLSLWSSSSFGFVYFVSRILYLKIRAFLLFLKWLYIYVLRALSRSCYISILRAVWCLFLKGVRLNNKCTYIFWKSDTSRIKSNNSFNFGHKILFRYIVLLGLCRMRYSQRGIFVYCMVHWMKMWGHNLRQNSSWFSILHIFSINFQWICSRYAQIW